MNIIKNIFIFVFLILFLCINSYSQERKNYPKEEFLTDIMTEAAPVKKGDKIIIPGFYFDDGSNAINKNLKKHISEIAKEVSKIKYNKIYIDGYTDNIGDNSLNNKLSRDRANGIRREFIKNGIPASKIQARAYGSIKPIASNDSKAGRIKNRRIEVLIK